MTRFTDFNRQISSPPIIRVCAMFVFLVAFLVYALPGALHGELNAPPEIGDAHHYVPTVPTRRTSDLFSINWDDADYRAPYLQKNQDGRYDELLNRQGEGRTAPRDCAQLAQ